MENPRRKNQSETLLWTEEQWEEWIYSFVAELEHEEASRICLPVELTEPELKPSHIPDV